MILGIGIDMASGDRLRRGVERHGVRFLERLFTPAEIAYAQRARDPYPRLAARFAAKEAFAKALGTGIGHMAFWRDIEVTRVEASGRPSLRLIGRAQAAVAERGVSHLHVTLSHEGQTAMAVVLLESD